MKYKLTEMPKRTLVGFKQHFGGVPYSREGAEQTARFYMTTRGKQWLLTGASCDHAVEYAVIANMTDEGYDFFIAYELDRWTMEHLFDASVTGMPEISALGLGQLDLPSAVCAVFETRRCKRPVPEYEEMARPRDHRVAALFGVSARKRAPRYGAALEARRRSGKRALYRDLPARRKEYRE